MVAFIVGVVVLVVGLAVSIALHEIGHLVPAKRFGVRVGQYMVGFGPTLWSRRRGETEYGVKAIPLGVSAFWHAKNRTYANWRRALAPSP